MNISAGCTRRYFIGVYTYSLSSILGKFILQLLHTNTSIMDSCATMEAQKQRIREFTGSSCVNNHDINSNEWEKWKQCD